MDPKEKNETVEREQEISTDTPLNPSFTLNTDMGAFSYHSAYPGDSVKDHKELEEANKHFAEKELGQERENL